MSGLVIKGVQVQVPGLTTTSWKDDPKLRLKIGEDGRTRHDPWVRAITLHTTKGIPGGSDHRPQKIIPGLGPNSNAEQRTALYWSTSPDGEVKQAGAHLVVDFDGSVGCCADLQTEVSFHAGPVNEVTIGIEIYQGKDAELYEGQLDAVVTLIDFLTATFKIQRQIQWPYHNGPVSRMEAGGKDVVGVYGHRDVTSNRGLGDPGNAVFEKLRAAGYLAFDMAKNEDLEHWKTAQLHLKETVNPNMTLDGVAGPGTAAALLASGRKLGQIISRPIDASL